MDLNLRFVTALRASQAANRHGVESQRLFEEKIQELQREVDQVLEAARAADNELVCVMRDVYGPHKPVVFEDHIYRLNGDGRITAQLFDGVIIPTEKTNAETGAKTEKPKVILIDGPADPFHASREAKGANDRGI